MQHHFSKKMFFSTTLMSMQPRFYAFKFRNNVFLKSLPILYFAYFINFHQYFSRFLSFRQDYFSFRPYLCLIVGIHRIIYFTITLPPLLILQNKIYLKTITVTKYDLQCGLRSFPKSHLFQDKNRSFVAKFMV